MTPENAYEAYLLKRRLEYLELTDDLLPYRSVIDPDLDISVYRFDREFSDINTFESFMSCLIEGRKSAASGKPKTSNI